MFEITRRYVIVNSLEIAVKDSQLDQSYFICTIFQKETEKKLTFIWAKSTQLIWLPSKVCKSIKLKFVWIGKYLQDNLISSLLDHQHTAANDMRERENDRNLWSASAMFDWDLTRHDRVKKYNHCELRTYSWRFRQARHVE